MVVMMPRKEVSNRTRTIGSVSTISTSTFVGVGFHPEQLVLLSARIYIKTCIQEPVLFTVSHPLYKTSAKQRHGARITCKTGYFLMTLR